MVQTVFLGKKIKSQWAEQFVVTWQCGFLQQEPKESLLTDVCFPEKSVHSANSWITHSLNQTTEHHELWLVADIKAASNPDL